MVMQQPQHYSRAAVSVEQSHGNVSSGISAAIALRPLDTAARLASVMLEHTRTLNRPRLAVGSLSDQGPSWAMMGTNARMNARTDKDEDEDEEEGGDEG